MRSRTIAIAGTILAMSTAGGFVTAAAASAHHKPAAESRLDRSRDLRSVRHVDRSPDRSGSDRSIDRYDR